MLGVSPKIGGGTNILVSSTITLVDATRHLRNNWVDMSVVIAIGFPSMIRAFVGGFLSGYMSETILMITVSLLVMWQGAEMAFSSRVQKAQLATTGKDPPMIDKRFKPFTNRDGFAAQAMIGSTIGVLGDATGLILGSLRLPTRIRIIRLNPHIAPGTNLFIGFILGSSGWLGHVIHGEVDYPLGIIMAISAMAGSYLGAKLTGRIDAHRLLTSMGTVLLTVSSLLV